MLLRLTCILGLALCATSAGAQSRTPSVGVIPVETRSIPRTLNEPGRAIASAEVEIRPRVAGPVTEVLYQAGTTVAAGDPMFQIEPAPYEAALVSAEADLASARASAREAEAAFDRAERLLGSGTAQVQVDTARSTLDQAQAKVQTAEVARDLARTDLDHTTVTSPIDGVAGFANVTRGDLVTANQADALAVVTQLDPIEVEIYAPSSGILALIEDVTSDRVRIADNITARLTLETGRTYDAAGQMIATGQSISQTTGARAIRFRFENPNGVLLPGMFVRSEAHLGTSDAILLPQSATTRLPSGALQAWFVAEDGTVEQRTLQERGSFENSWIVAGDVADGDLLVLDGLALLRDGMEVHPVPARLDADGVVRDLPGSAEGE